MNRYRHRFTVACPNNAVPVEYDLTIETRRTIMVEEIVKACRVDQAFHEALADTLLHAFGGRQTLRAHHHGVDIETVRGAAE